MSDHRFREEIQKNKLFKQSPLNINNQDFFKRERERERERERDEEREIYT